MLAVYPARGCRDKRARVVLVLALVLRDQGDLQGARTLHQRALTIREAAWDPTTPTPPKASATSPSSCTTRATLTTPRTLFERALTILEARPGPDHPATVRSRERLAAVVAALENRQ
jgi:Tetratricopeptide repeat